ncbi:SDR family oxidoreductase [Nocardia mexicana]|uniref:NAD(P)-dependent dehydrogenase (Short-subunit alcohol dehydrogenase family) n=1 Tax=Nocardia mexicana TaxID=279262 RepID=A0A370GPE6_9NOCA|nr:SDR family oxidoreductase [Nocardia mexicana]RDI45116.1 NAD(P)-dependent dehydrogenase (short-subunit alcohol dehydrogenase family) [Nocardia mexicana]
MVRDVLVVIGTGGMGRAIARRQGGGRHVLLADFDEAALREFAGTMEDEGHLVTTAPVDVGSRESVAELAAKAASLGSVTQIVHTAGLSPSQAPVAAILRVDLVGVGLVLEEFGRIVARGGAGVVIASMGGYLGVLSAEHETALATTAVDDLLGLPFLASDAVTDPGFAYALAKRANHLQVRAASGAWGARGARINSISPGIISTPMGRQELASESGAGMRAMIDMSATGRAGTPDDIAAAAAYLLGPDASFVTGTDLLVDGGVVAAVAAAAVRAAAHS